MKHDRLCEGSPENNCGNVDGSTFSGEDMMMTSTQVVKMSVSVITNSPSQNYTHLDEHTSLTCHEKESTVKHLMVSHMAVCRYYHLKKVLYMFVKFKQCTYCK